jgi:chromosome segregation ATPase
MIPPFFLSPFPFPFLLTVFQGRLGDLGSTACGALDKIVVETAEAGQKCEQFLHENGLGFCTFILMDKIEQQYHDRMQPTEVPDKAKW